MSDEAVTAPVRAKVWGPRKRKPGKAKDRKSWAWVVVVQYPDGKRETTSFKQDREAADAYAARMRSELHVVGAATMDRNITVEQCAAIFLKAAKEKKPGTYFSYEQNCRVHIVPAFPMRVRDVTQQHVAAFGAKLLQDGMADGTAYLVFGILKQVLEVAVFERVIVSNPAKGVWRRVPVRARARRKSKKLRREDVRALSFEELDAFILSVLGSSLPQPLRAFWLTLAHSGMRPGECAALRPSDVRGTILRVERSLAPEHYAKGHVGAGAIERRMGTTKTDMPRDFEMGVDLAKFLAEYVDAAKPAEWLFAHETGLPIPRHTIKNSFALLMEATGLTANDYTPKSLRHTYASHMLMKGVPFLWVARQIGDTPETLLKAYSWAVPDKGAVWANTLDQGRELSTALFRESSTDSATARNRNEGEPAADTAGRRVNLNRTCTGEQGKPRESVDELAKKPESSEVAPSLNGSADKHSRVSRNRSQPNFLTPKKASRRGSK